MATLDAPRAILLALASESRPNAVPEVPVTFALWPRTVAYSPPEALASLPSTVEPVVASTPEPIATDSATAFIFLFASRPIAILSSPLKLLPAFTPIAIL